MIYDKPRDVSFSGLHISPPIEKTVNPEAAKMPPKKNRAFSAKASAFFLVLYAGAVLAFIIPLRPTYSDTEKRSLAAFPEFSVGALTSGEYFDGISVWFSDTFPFREQLTKMNTSLKKFAGFDTVAIHGDVEKGDDIPDAPFENSTEPSSENEQTTAPVAEVQTTAPTEVQTTLGEKPNINVQSMGAILVAGNAAYEYYNFSNTLAPRYINAVNNIKTVAPNCNAYTLVVPTSMDIDLNDAIRADINTSDQKKALDYFNGSFSGVTAVTGIYENLKAHRDDYQYFRTDHHWTALGAYRAYECFCSAKGIAPVPIAAYETVKYGGFLGTFYSSSSQSDALGNTPDTVIAYKPFNNIDFKITEENGSVLDWDVIADVTEYSSSLKYLAFIGGDMPFGEITNSDLSDGSACLVIKESYGNAFVSFLIPHYQHIYIVDPRHYQGDLSGFLSQYDIDDIVFVSNISTTRNSIFIEAMEEFVR